jgi:ABC transporter substrate binding protein (PQQ-dependent alcohol dehydrogenase system)
VVEQWGAVQLQNRFEQTAGRDMRSRDYAAWTAVRAIGEAVTRTGSADPATLRDYMLSDAFQLDGFKGRGLSFRSWNGQLRQPIAVANARALVTLAPVEGFLHQRNETDTLGLDEPESQCHAFTE